MGDKGFKTSHMKVVNWSNFIKLICLTIATAATLSFNWWGPNIEYLSEFSNVASLRLWFEGLGVWGPVAIIGSMVVAILVSPLPSAPIALSAGAIYGHFWGALYVLSGAEIGAIIAFCITRFLGYDLLHSKFGLRLNNGLIGSQRFLTWTVFASRLMPFISFDIISYAAGLTSLSLWRFAAATLAGIIPSSFLLAHFGSELSTGETEQMLLATLFISIIIALPFVIRRITRAQQD